MGKKWIGLAVAVLVVGAASFTLLRPGSLQQGLRDGITFNKGGNWAAFIEGTEGFSPPEDWGRWTDAAHASIEFNKDLPKKFKLRITARVFGGNGKQPIMIVAGGIAKSVVFDGFEVDERVVEFDGVQGPLLEFQIPSPMQANEVVPGSMDTRRLGLGLVRLGMDD